MHVHTREDSSGKWNYKEDFISASKAAAHGGVTFAMDMTNSPTPLTTEELYLERKKLATEKSSIDLVLAAPIGPDSTPFSFPTPYKLFMTHSVGDLFFKNKRYNL
jgi:dihydroorotase-like cyclic amidohydrolase